jgi:hypothetical protein
VCPTEFRVTIHQVPDGGRGYSVVFAAVRLELRNQRQSISSLTILCNSSGVYICKSIVNDLRHGNYICKSEGNYLRLLRICITLGLKLKQKFGVNKNLENLSQVWVVRLGMFVTLFSGGPGVLEMPGSTDFRTVSRNPYLDLTLRPRRERSRDDIVS